MLPLETLYDLDMRGARGRQNSSRGSRSQNRGPERKFRTHDPGILSHQRQKKRDPKLKSNANCNPSKVALQKIVSSFSTFLLVNYDGIENNVFKIREMMFF